MPDSIIEREASRRAAELELSGSHKIAGFKEGYIAAYNDALLAQKRRKQAYVPGHAENIWDRLLRIG